MSTSVWMPLYVSDYLADTTHLTAEEHGSYLLLIFAYWRRQGPLPDDDTYLAKIARVGARRWKTMRATLTPFFEVSESSGWKHSRVEKEIARSRDVSSARQNAGKSGGRPKQLVCPEKPNGFQNESKPEANEKQNETQSQSQSHIEIKKIEVPDLRATRGRSKEWIKQRWEQGISQDIIEGMGPEEGMRWIERYQAGDPDAKRLFNEISDARKADKALRQELGWKP